MSIRLTCWLTRGLLAAMLLAVLAPAVSRVLARSRVAGDWVEICTLQGMQWVQLTEQGIPAEPEHSSAQNALDPCAHCTLTAERFAPLLPSPTTVSAGDGTWVSPAYLADASHVLMAPSPGARGPPLLS